MMCDWTQFLALCTFFLIVDSLPMNLMNDGKKTEQTMRPKPKRAQEMLMFGNQQNRQADSNTGNSYASAADKRTLSSAGLGGLKAALAEEEKPSHSKAPSNSLFDRDEFSPYDQNYEYGKVLVDELDEKMPQVWDVSPYTRYYINEDRRKRSEKGAPGVSSTTVRPSATSFQSPTPTQQSVQAQMKRSIPIYQEPRIKRELNIDPEDVLILLSLWETERRNRNLRKYINDEYDSLDDDANFLDEEDPRNVIPWMDSAVYPPRHYGMESLSPSDIGIVRTHPPSYYEQYGNQFGQQYDGSSQQGYYNTPEKRFMISRKRSQSYDPYSSAAQFQIGSQRGYPAYQHRLVY